jgi:hypothetical protein
MAEKHILSLEIPVVANTEIMSIVDTSQYSDKLAIDCAELLITAPGFNSPSLTSVTQGFYLNLNACDLNLQTTNCGTIRTELPDGVYIIKYSVAPNDKVYVEYNHLRVTKLLTLYYETLCNIDVMGCTPASGRSDIIDEIKYIKTVIDGAVAKVEYCGSPQAGMSLYDFAKKRLDKLNCKIVGC